MPVEGEACAPSNLDAAMFQSIDALSSGLKLPLWDRILRIWLNLYSRKKNETQEVTVLEFECAATDHNTRLAELEATVSILTSQVELLGNMCEDLESRSRRNNINFIGITKGAEGSALTTLFRIDWKICCNWRKRHFWFVPTVPLQRNLRRDCHLDHFLSGCTSPTSGAWSSSEKVSLLLSHSRQESLRISWPHNISGHKVSCLYQCKLLTAVLSRC